MNLELEDNKSINSDINSNKSSWDSLKKLRAQFQTVNNSSNVNSSDTFKQNNTLKKNTIQSSSHQNFQIKLKNAPISQLSSSNYQDNFKTINSQNTNLVGNFWGEENSNINNLNNLSQEEIKNQIEIVKNLYEKKLLEINQIYSEINIKETKIIELSQSIGKLLENDSNNTKANQLNLQKEAIIHNQRLKEISELKIEINNVKRKHNKKLEQIEKEYENEINESLEKINEEYTLRIREFNEDHNKNIKILQDDILLLKNKLEKLENQNEYISKTKHEETLKELQKVKFFK
jgi:hypothetical protein